MSMIETLDAVEKEKEKHNSTRMEALARLATLEVFSLFDHSFASSVFLYLELSQHKLQSIYDNYLTSYIDNFSY